MDVRKKILKKSFVDSLMSITDFKDRHGISSQAVAYAIREDLIDYIKVSSRVKIVVLTRKTLDYTPNASKNRSVAVAE